VPDRIAQRRARHLGPQIGVEGRQQLALLGEKARGRDEVFGPLSDAGGGTGRAEQAGADPCGMALAGERDHGNAHPQRCAGGRGAVVGEGGERDLDLATGARGRGIGGERHPVRVDAGGRDCTAQVPGGRIAAVRDLEQKPRAGHRPQHLRPQRDHLAVDLRRVVERAEGHVTGAQDRGSIFGAWSGAANARKQRGNRIRVSV
jgi:hypothetical protein